MTDEISNIVRNYDRDRYLASLFAPDDKREALLALFAFNTEISRIRYVVSEPQIGEIRLQFWADTLNSIEEGTAQSHPVANALMKTFQVHDLPLEPLQRLISAHQFDLYADHFPTLNDVEGYLGETSSIIIQLSGLILDRNLAEKFAAAAGLTGVAYGLARHVSQLDLLPTLKPIDSSIDDLKSLAAKRLEEARAYTIPQALWSAFLPASLTNLYLAQSQSPSNWRKQWHLWRAARRGTL